MRPLGLIKLHAFFTVRFLCPFGHVKLHAFFTVRLCVLSATSNCTRFSLFFFRFFFLFCRKRDAGTRARQSWMESRAKVRGRLRVLSRGSTRLTSDLIGICFLSGALVAGWSPRAAARVCEQRRHSARERARAHEGAGLAPALARTHAHTRTRTHTHTHVAVYLRARVRARVGFHARTRALAHSRVRAARASPAMGLRWLLNTCCAASDGGSAPAAEDDASADAAAAGEGAAGRVEGSATGAATGAGGVAAAGRRGVLAGTCVRACVCA